MRLYISGPITGINDYVNNFKTAQDILNVRGFNTINPAPLSQILPNGDYEEYMAIDFKLIDIADGICLIKGWEHSNGAKREYEYAIANGKHIYHIEDIIKAS